MRQPVLRRLQIVFHHPATGIPPDTLGIPVQGWCRHRGQQDPLQGVLAFGRLVFSGARDPHQEGLKARRQHSQLIKGGLELSRAYLLSMTGRNIEWMATRPGPRAHQIAARKAPYALLSRQVHAWEAKLIHIRALVAPASLSGDAERARGGHTDTGHVSDAQGVEKVRLLDAKAIAVPASPVRRSTFRSASPTRGEPRRRKTRGVDSCRVAQG